MNNYKTLDKIFHKFALSSKIVREVSFDLENSLIKSKSLKGSHVFITGLARSGTTILLNAIYRSNIFASLTYEDMPFVLAPNLWSKIPSIKSKIEPKERAHGDGIKFSLQSPEAFEEVFWRTFSDSEIETFEDFKDYTNNICFKYKKDRYLSKNNQNVKRILDISNYFQKSKILIPFRDPIQHSNSLLLQHKKFINYSKNDSFIAKYMKWIGHTEFGPNYIPINKENLNFLNPLDINHWLEQWIKNYKNCLRIVNSRKNINLISYQKLCNSKNYWSQILELLDVDYKYEFEFKESQKTISLAINKELIEESYSLYSALEEKSFLNS